MSETGVSQSPTEHSVISREQSDLKRPSQIRCKLQPSSVLDDVSKSKSGSIDAIRYRKRRRRGKSKRRRVKPYSRAWQDRSEHEEREGGKRANNVRAKLFASGLPVAPYNTTQFLMEDHNDLQNLDVKLQAVTTNTDGTNVPVLQRQSRVRDSSLSVDSGEDYFYSSPEDEGDFLSKNFSNEYEDLHAERLNNMSKAQLIEEYIQMEARVDMLEKRLKKSNPDGKGDSSMALLPKEGESNEGNRNCDPSQKIITLKQEIDKLYMENEQLRRENDRLRCSYLKDQSVHSESSVDSESDSTPSPCRCDTEVSCSCHSSESESIESSSSDVQSLNDECYKASEPSEEQSSDQQTLKGKPNMQEVSVENSDGVLPVRTFEDNEEMK